MAETVNLEWENHHQIIGATFKRLYEDETLTDVTIYCKDGPIRAHKLVMSICSPYFSRIYQMNPGVHMVVMVNGITMKEMQLLLEYMYKGTVAIPAEYYEKVAQAAEQLEMKNFRKPVECDEKNNFFQKLEMTKRHEEKKCKFDVNKTIADYPDISISQKSPAPEKFQEEEELTQEDNGDLASEESPEETAEPPKPKAAKENSTHPKTHTRSGKNKPYVCTFCPSSFKRSSHLTRHRLIHTGEKPFSCQKCDKSFSRLDKLKQHMRGTHHGSLSLRYDDNNKRPLNTDENLTSKKRHRGRPRKFSEDTGDLKKSNYDITNLPFGDLNYLTMPDTSSSPTMNPMEPLVEIKDVSGGVKFDRTPRVAAVAPGTLGKIGECTVSVTTNG